MFLSLYFGYITRFFGTFLLFLNSFLGHKRPFCFLQLFETFSKLFLLFCILSSNEQAVDIFSFSIFSPFMIPM